MKTINLLSMESLLSWNFWYPNNDMAPISEISKEGHDICLNVFAQKPHTYGKWCHKVLEIDQNYRYIFHAEYDVNSGLDENSHVHAMLTWTDADGKMLTRDYADLEKTFEDGWRRLSYDSKAPENAVSVEIELVFRWVPCNAKISWRKVTLTETQTIERKPVRVVTTLVNNLPGDRSENLKKILLCIDKAALLKPDIICLSEGIYTFGCDDAYACVGDEIPNPFTEILSKKAKEFRCYLVANLFEKCEDGYYNTSLLFDRMGNIQGKYRKVHLPLSEAEWGILPGDEYPVFETDFGKIGMLICWDHWFPESARILRLKGAEIIFISTNGDAYIQSLARAVDNGIHVVVSGFYGDNPSRIINPDGKIIAQSQENDLDAVSADIVLSTHQYKQWLSVGDAGGDMRNIFIRERRPETYGLMVDSSCKNHIT